MAQTNTDDPRVIAGMAAQGRLRESRLHAGERRVGWKAGLGTEAAMTAVSIATALTGFLTNASLASGMTTTDGLSIEDWRNAKLEAEVAVRVDRTVPAGADRETVAAAIAEMAPAIEIVDLGDPADVEQALAGNLFHRAFAFGPFKATTGAGLGAARLTIAQDGQIAHGGVDPAAVLGDLVDVVRAVADQIPLSDDELTAGDVIMTGSAIVPVSLAGGERFEIALDGAGSVELQIAPNAGTG
jgi:2-oxopent-4-enoate/cis-2-oxohex-4-enoate hydratase